MSSTIENDIPSNSEFDGSGAKPWRIADGKLKKGREGEPGYEERAHIVGKLKTVFIKSGTSDTGEPYEYVAADLENVEDGKFVVHASTNSKVSAGTFASALLLTDGGEVISISPNKSAKPTKFGNFVTYTNVKVRTAKGWAELRNDEFMQVEEAVEKLKDLPHFRVWEPTKTGDDVVAEPLSHLENYIDSRGWAGPGKSDAHFAAWCDVVNKVAKAKKFPEIADLSDIGSELCEVVVTELTKLSAVPKTIAAVPVAVAAVQVAPSDDFDPFADE